MPTTTEHLSFPGADGHRLAARLDRPRGRPRAYCLFTHCFTCSKDLLAVARIAEALTERGLAVLRFDFTGLGASEGEFEATSFSSNVADLLQAVAYLREHHEAPTVLVGHSLGGTAVLAAAADVPEARAVATIGAPADADHVLQHFHADLGAIERDGESEVTLGGRRFRIRRQLVENLRAQNVRARVSGMRKALLVMHAPRDQVVGIENAGTIFEAARHPKSFVSLDDADHLLTRREDAVYAAEVLAAWASRYLLPPAGVPAEVSPPAGVVRVEESGRGKLEQDMTSGRHRLIADEPVEVGGGDAGPSPYDLLSMALGACTSMTLRLYAGHKGLALGRVRVDVSHGKVHARDCADCGEGREGRIDRFERVLTLEGSLDEESRRRLLEIADRCPVHKTLSATSAIVTRLSQGETE